MKIRATQRIRLEDFPDQKDWIGKLVGPINEFITQAIRILNNGITFADNLVGEEHLFDFVYQSTDISLPVGFAWKLTSAPRALSVISATEDGDPVNISVSWDYNEEGLVRLRSIVKLNSSSSISGFTAATGTESRATFDTATVTTAQLAQRVKALIDDLLAVYGVDSLTTGSRYKIKVRVTP